jgi:hypothetical protein
MSLNKKAKTLEQWLYGSQCTSLNEVMVRLEDAEQTLEELKQKLQQLLAEFPSSIGGVPKVNWRAYVYSTEEVDEWKRKFEGLLKERDAKP